MKVFLVFMAVIVFAAGIIVYTEDMNYYAELQHCLKHLAEECAEYGALCIDREALAKGEFRTDAASAKAAVNDLLADNTANSKLSAGTVRADVYVSGAACSVNLSYDGPDIFRLPILTRTHIERSSAYEWKGF